MAIERVVSGMRPTGSLHLGHYNGVLKNWVDLQHELECLFFVAVECKQPVIDSITKELKPISERAKKYAESPELVQSIIGEGCEKARKIARDTMRDVREVMGISF